MDGSPSDLSLLVLLTRPLIESRSHSVVQNDDTKQSAAKKGAKSKKPLKGFMLFSQEHREKVKKENPEFKFGAIGKKLGEMWRALSDEKKEEYKNPK